MRIYTLEIRVMFIDLCLSKLFKQMKNIKVKWNKVSPADISSTSSAQYFAFSKRNNVFLINEVNKECLFTKIIMASASLSHSIYDMDIWVGYVVKGMDSFNNTIQQKEMIEDLEWVAKVQLEDVHLTPAYSRA